MWSTLTKRPRLLGMPTGRRRIVFAIEISVVAGVEISDQIAVERGRGRDRRVFVTVPAPEILRIDAREETIEQYFVREGLRGIDWVDVSGEVEAAKERNRADAVEPRYSLRRGKSSGVVDP